jgi:hypothetical protein
LLRFAMIGGKYTKGSLSLIAKPRLITGMTKLR